MILGVDPGLATCGWALVTDQGRPVRLGVALTERTPRVASSVDRVRRLRWQAEHLRGLARGARTLAAEAASYPRMHSAVAALALSWGNLVGLATCLDLPLVEVSPKVWQGAIGKGLPYVEIERRLAAYVGQVGTSEAKACLRSIPKRHRNHALDALGVAVWASQQAGRG